MGKEYTDQICAMGAIEAGREIRRVVHGLEPADRARPCTSLLKPDAQQKARYADDAAEQVAVRHLERISHAVGYKIRLLVDPMQRKIHTIGNSDETRNIWAYVDAVDGTIKVAGLGNDLENNKFRGANDGNWGAAFAFTKPTEKNLEQLTLGDFTAAAIIDGNPTTYKTYPHDVVATKKDAREAYDYTQIARRIHTSSNTNLGQTMVSFESFQAYDRNSAKKGDETLAVELYRRLINRNEGGAFDVLRTYGNLSALPKAMLGWRDTMPWYESQGGAFIVINENLANLIPAVPIILAAGGVATDFDGNPLEKRGVVQGRTNVIYAANWDIEKQVLEHIQHARAAAASYVRPK